MDIKKKAEELVQKIQKNPGLLKEFRENPVKIVEELIGIDLPDDEIMKLAQMVEIKIDMDKAGDMLKGLGGLFQ